MYLKKRLQNQSIVQNSSISYIIHVTWKYKSTGVEVLDEKYSLIRNFCKECNWVLYAFVHWTGIFKSSLNALLIKKKVQWEFLWNNLENFLASSEVWRIKKDVEVLFGTF